MNPISEDSAGTYTVIIKLVDNSTDQLSNTYIITITVIDPNQFEPKPENNTKTEEPKDLSIGFDINPVIDEITMKGIAKIYFPDEMILSSNYSVYDYSVLKV